MRQTYHRDLGFGNDLLGIGSPILSRTVIIA
jgi:hypothetical protein